MPIVRRIEELDPLITRLEDTVTRLQSLLQYSEASASRLQTLIQKSDDTISRLESIIQNTSTVIQNTANTVNKLDTVIQHASDTATKLGNRAASPKHGQVTVGTSVVQLPNVSIPAGFTVVIRADLANTGVIYIGESDVSASNGFPLAAGDAVLLRIDNLNRVYAVASADNQKLAYIVEG
ncbi:MAG: hypothetical protein QXY39_04200 [Thermofilaceae archaeon]